MQQSIYIFCLPCPNQQTRYNSMQRPSDGTDRRTPDCYIDPVPNTMRAVSTMVQQCFVFMQKNNAVFHRGQKAVLLRSALLLRMTPNHAHHPTVIADAGKQLTTTLTISELEQKC